MATNKKDTAATPSNVALFAFPVTGQTVRMVIHEGKPWFVARDVVFVLGYKSAKNVIRYHCKHQKTLRPTTLTDSPRGINIIPESDVFRLIARTSMPQADPVQDWLIREVLPAIHKDRPGPLTAAEVLQPTHNKPSGSGAAVEREQEDKGMMTVFQKQGFGRVRVVKGEDGEPWFVAKDVLTALDYAETYSPSRAIQAVPDEWKGVQRLNTPGGFQETSIISEQGLYFFLARSDKPAALPFQKWIAGEILPTIRKTGQYQTPQPNPANTAAPAPQPDALSAILSRLVSIEQQITPLKEKANRYDAFLAVDGTCSLTQAAKLFNMTGIGLGRLLRGEHMKWLFKRPGRNGDANLPTKETIELGYMVAKAVRSPYNGALSIQARFTPVGLDALHQKLECLRRELLPLPEGTPDASTVREATYDCTPVNRPQ